MLHGLLQFLSNHGIPQGLVIQATFYGIAGLTVLFAFLVVMSRDIFHSAVFLVLTLFGVACVYLYLDAEFLAGVQILIYIGAIMTLFIFAIMLTSDAKTRLARKIDLRIALSAGAALAIFAIFLKIIRLDAWQPQTLSPTPLGLTQIGKSLMTDFGLPFEVISLLSLAALVGAIVIGKVEKK
jgi:NADH-quinone oxidoreductase subunit J